MINTTIEEFNTGLPHDLNPQVSGEIRKALDYCFHPGQTTIHDILDALAAISKARGTPRAVVAWAATTANTIRDRSPTSVKVALAQMRRGHEWNISETFQTEYNVARKFMQNPDFVEGVSALLMEKPKRTPNWEPASLDDVREAKVESFFNLEQPLELLNTAQHDAYHEYPYAFLGLPTERQVEAFVRDARPRSHEEVVAYFLQVKEGKMGVREKVTEILDRMGRMTDEGTLLWDSAENVEQY